ncbi:MAG: hypothetical protein QF577_07150 [Phycisphaerae bacterium]|nr:hypothetical protein [Candidatus Thalassarchaeaceae archaeon]MDP7637307.1 hypothetical protein [Phycisphaerae bacterium]|tara:strand:- start:773 stop:1081 length:309 start_codon:yes stop_codon:yes gene_type:complete
MGYKLGSSPEEREAHAARMGELADIHQELSLLVDYPPFSINPKEQNNFVEDFTLGIDEDDDDPFAEVMQKWADEIAEARMYQKRYPGDSEAATQAAAKIQSG